MSMTTSTTKIEEKFKVAASGPGVHRAYSKLVWSHKGNKSATNGKGAALLRVRNPR